MSKRRSEEGGAVTVGDDTVCYVLITCKKPSNDGNMLVEMSYEGDPDLASYLVQSAQLHLQEEIQAMEGGLS